MMKRQHAEKEQKPWSAWRIARLSFFTAIVIELVTLVSRFGFGLQSTRDTQFLGAWTLGYRIHHGYIGLVGLVLVGLMSPKGGEGKWRQRLLILSIGLIASDLVHHFVVLWLTTGSPQFDLRYE